MAEEPSRYLVALMVLDVVFASAVLTIPNLSAINQQLRNISLHISRTYQPQQASLGIYWDRSCTNTTSSIGWGLLIPGANKNIVLYVRNEGNIPVTLHKDISNWNPSMASSYITLDWDYANESLETGSVVAVKLQLVVSSNAPAMTNLNFDTTITPTS